MNVAQCQWEESSIDSGFSSDIESNYNKGNSDKRNRSSWYCDRENNNVVKRKGNSRSLPSQFRADDCWRLNEVSLTDFTHIRNLGGGGFAKVDLVQLQREDARKFYALKKVSKKLFSEPKQEQQFEAEKHVLSLSHSRFIPKLYRTFFSSNHVFLLIEACLHGDLFSHLERHGPMRCNTARYVIGCVTEALDYLHNTLHVIHRDIKTENILIGYHGVAKVADLGFCKVLGSSRELTHTFCGTPGYIAPEVLMHTGHSYNADFFSLGVVAYELLTCRSPFRRVALIDTHKATLRGITEVAFPSIMDHVTKSFVRGLCYREPERRLGEEIRSHEWFYGFKWKELQSGQMPSPLQISTNTCPTTSDVRPV